jgi:hypothetical protein
MAKVIKPVIDNKVYSEIIFRLGTNKYYVNQFIEHFMEDEDIFSEKKPTKERSVLARQMTYLLKEGFIKTILEQEKGKKFKHNIKRYYNNFNKITEEFLRFYLKYLNSKDNITEKEIKLYNKIKEDEKQNKPSNAELDFEKYRYIEAINKLNEKSFLKNSLNNVFVKYLIRRIIEEPRQLNINLSNFTLKDYFFLLINSGVFHYFVEDIEKRFFESLYEEEGIDALTKETVFDYIHKDLKKDYEFFKFEFIPIFEYGQTSALLYWFSRALPYSFAQVLRKGFH